MIPAEAVEAAVKARRDLKLDRYYKTREVVSTTYEGNRIFRSAPEPTEEEYARAALEAAAPYMLADELSAEYRRGYRDGLTDRKQVTAEPRAWEPGDPIE